MCPSRYPRYTGPCGDVSMAQRRIWRSTPSNVKPARSATRRDAALSGLHEPGGLSVISFKSPLGQLDSNGHVRIRFCIYLRK